MNYKLLSTEEIKQFLPLIQAERVSLRARKPDGFLTVYLSGRNISKEVYPGKEHSYLVERQNFLKRTIPAYVRKPTLRRLLSLISWAYLPGL